MLLYGLTGAHLKLDEIFALSTVGKHVMGLFNSKGMLEILGMKDSWRLPFLIIRAEE